MAAWKLFLFLFVCSTLSVNCEDSSAFESEKTSEEVTEEPSGPQWSYNGHYPPTRWPELYNTCSSDNKRQSPIDIDVGQSIFDDELGPIKFYEKINRMHKQTTIVNKGYTVKVDVPHEAYVDPGTLPNSGFRVAGVTFTWGSDYKQGSEHKLNAVSYPLEMLIYAYDETRYEDAEAALEGNDALAVFSVLFEVTDEDNIYLQRVIKGLKNIETPGSIADIPHVTLSNLLPRDTNQYFRYYGSLTKPPCSQNVIYTVFTQRNTISADQLMEFRRLKYSPTEDEAVEVLQNNFRPVQPIADRVVYRSYLFRNEMSRVEMVIDDHADNASPCILPQTYLLVFVILSLFNSFH